MGCTSSVAFTRRVNSGGCLEAETEGEWKEGKRGRLIEEKGKGMT